MQGQDSRYGDRHRARSTPPGPAAPPCPRGLRGLGGAAPSCGAQSALPSALPTPGHHLLQKAGSGDFWEPQALGWGTHRRTYGEARRLGRGLLRARCLPEAECQAVRATSQEGPPGPGLLPEGSGSSPWALAPGSNGFSQPAAGDPGPPRGAVREAKVSPPPSCAHGGQGLGSPRHGAGPTQSQQARGRWASPLPQGPAAAHAHCGLPGCFLPRGPRIEGGRTP